MGTYVNGANGNFSGKVGSMIGSKWRSVSYIKGLTTPSTKPATTLQLAQRSRMALAVSFLRPIKDVLNLGMLDGKQTELSGYNLAVRKLLNNGITGDYPDFAIDYSKVVLSAGALNLVNDAKMALLDGVLTVSWNSLVNKFNSFDDDELVVLLYNSTKEFFMIFDEVRRSATTLAPEIGGAAVGDEIHGWVFACKRDFTDVSKTQYLGKVTIA
jgi:hypothetical protein